MSGRQRRRTARFVVVLTLVLTSCESIGAPTGSNGGPSVTTPPVDDPIAVLVEQCEAEGYSACDELALAAEPGSQEELLGSTCGGRVAEPRGSCVDIFGAGADPLPTSIDESPFSTNTEVRAAGPQGDPPGPLADVRLAAQDGFDRFVLEFDEGGMPEYSVGYTDDGLLQLVVGSTTPDGPDGGPLEDRVFALGSRLVSASMVENTRDAMTWILVVEGVPGFEVLTLDGPPRLVIDISQQ
jgi:hypothetical protein